MKKNIRPQRIWALKNPKKVKKYAENYRNRNRLDLRTQSRNRAREVRIEVMKKYGGQCSCCKESELVFLSIDHINGDGAAHRKILKGYNLSRWIKKNNYPDGFQILCYNCNNAKKILGHCPHKKVL